MYFSWTRYYAEIGVEATLPTDVTVADVLGVSVIYIRYYILFDHTNWWLLTSGYSFGIFVLINTHIDKY